MTFFEAAVEVLHQAGRALHYKKITEIAIEQGLLSHVGKTPHVTMEARLGQEADKSVGARVRRVRPGVYVLGRDLDQEQLKETERTALDKLEGPAPRNGQSSNATPEPSPAPSDRPRRRRRRGPLVDGPLDEEEPKGRPSRRDSRRPTPPLPPQPTAPPPTRVRLGGGAPSLVEAVSEALSQAEQPMTAAELAATLSAEPDDDVSPLVLEQIIQTLNRRRVRDGRHPPFSRLERGWVLTQGEVQADLLDTYDAIEEAHDRLMEVATSTLVRALQKLDGQHLDAFVRATLEGLGFETNALDATAGRASGAGRDADQVFVAAEAREGLVPIKALVAIWHADTPVTSNVVAALRGRLQRYGATHGVIVSVRRGSIEPDARGEAAAVSPAQPIVLYDAKSLAPLALRARVAVTTYPIEVPLIDASWFTAG